MYCHCIWSSANPSRCRNDIFPIWSNTCQCRYHRCWAGCRSGKLHRKKNILCRFLLHFHNNYLGIGHNGGFLLRDGIGYSHLSLLSRKYSDLPIECQYSSILCICLLYKFSSYRSSAGRAHTSLTYHRVNRFPACRLSKHSDFSKVCIQARTLNKQCIALTWGSIDQRNSCSCLGFAGRYSNGFALFYKDCICHLGYSTNPMCKIDTILQDRRCCNGLDCCRQCISLDSYRNSYSLGRHRMC